MLFFQLALILGAGLIGLVLTLLRYVEEPSKIQEILQDLFEVNVAQLPNFNEQLQLIQDVLEKRTAGQYLVIPCHYFLSQFPDLWTCAVLSIDFRVLGSLLLLILLGAFLAFSSLGAGLDQRTRTPLGAHQQRFRSQ